MTIRLYDTVMDGNMGDGWADEYAAACEYARRLDAAYRAEFGEDAIIKVNVLANTSGSRPPSYHDDSGDRWTFETDPDQRIDQIRNYVWEQFCNDPPADLVA